MTKQQFGPQPWLFPNPTVLVGTMVNGKPNVAAYAWSGITGGDPPTISVGVRHSRYTLEGILRNRTFSVNIPSADLIKETDYCGIATGSRDDKFKDCNWDVFYGDVKGAPYIEQCSVNIGCTAEHILKLGSHYLIAGPIKEIYVSDDCMKDGKPDVQKIDPIIYLTYPAGTYNKVGDYLGKAFSIGKEIKSVPDDWERQLAK